MLRFDKYYIQGEWVNPINSSHFDLVDPSNSKVYGQVLMGSKNDVDKAVKAARDAFPSFSSSSINSRVELLDAIIQGYHDRWNEIADAMFLDWRENTHSNLAGA